MPDQEGQPQIDKSQFLRLLDAYFDPEEVKTLCFTMEITYGNLPGETKIAKVRELILYAENHGRLGELLERSMAERPHIDWSTVIKSKRQALIIWFTKYTDSRLNALHFSDADGWSLKRILNDPEIGQFDDTSCLLNPSSQELHLAVRKLFSGTFSPDVLLLYVIGHGLVGEFGNFYLATMDTDIDRLQETAVSAQYITDEMDRCQSLQKILILDCSFGTLTPTAGVTIGDTVGVNTIFMGNEQGRTILTAGNTVQFAWEEHELVGTAAFPPFTRLLVNCLANGEADLDQNDTIAIDELYSYLLKHEQGTDKWSYGQETTPVIARRARKPSYYMPHLSNNLPDTIQTRMLDAAIAREVVVGEPTELLAQVRLKTSDGLKGVLELDIDYEARPEDVKSRSVQLEFPLDEQEQPQGISLSLKVSSPDFEPPAQNKKIVVPPDGDSEPCVFQLTPRRVGQLGILLELYDTDEIMTASTKIRITCQEREVKAVGPENRILVSIPLETIVRSFHEREKEPLPTTIDRPIKNSRQRSSHKGEKESLSMGWTIRGRRREALEKRREDLLLEYEAINEQLSRTSSAADSLRLKRELKHVNKQIDEVNAEIAKLERPRPEPDPTPPPRPSLGAVIAILLVFACGVLSLTGKGRTIIAGIFPTATEPVVIVLPTPMETPSRVADILPTATEQVVAVLTPTKTLDQVTAPVCPAPRPTPTPSPGDIGGTVTFIEIETTGCMEIKERRPKFQLSWMGVPSSVELWLIVKPKDGQLYFPHYCTQIQTSEGGQDCAVTLLTIDSYDIVIVLANESAHQALLELRDHGGILYDELPSGITEKSSLQVFRTD